MVKTSRSRCGACRGTGEVIVQGGDWDHDVPDICLACEDQWCRDIACQLLPRHLENSHPHKKKVPAHV